MVKGKLHIVNKRKYCLKCSPFGLHNTRPFGYVKLASTKHSCPCCNNPHRGRTRLCLSCQTNIRRFKLKERAVVYLGGKCIHCGYNKCIAALGFHHRNPAEKLFQIGGSHSRSWKVIQRELDKCDLTCANCHAEQHWNESNNYRNYQRKIAEGTGA